MRPEGMHGRLDVSVMQSMDNLAAVGERLSGEGIDKNWALRGVLHVCEVGCWKR